MILSLEEMKAYLKIDYADEDNLITSMIIAGEEYFKNATGKDFSEGEVPELVRLALKMLVAHWYENRGNILIGTISTEIAFTLKNILFQVKWGD